MFFSGACQVSVVLTADIRDWKPETRKGMDVSFVLSLLFHGLVALLVLYRLALWGSPGPGGGDAAYRLAMGAGHDRFAAQGAINATLVHVEKPKPKPVEEPKAEVKPKPVAKEKVEPAPNPKAKIKPRTKKPKPKPVEEVQPQPAQTTTTEPPQTAQAPASEMTLEEELAGMARGMADGKGQGAGGNAPETIKNKKGTLMLGSQVQSQMSGRTFRLNILGRGDISGGNNAINTVIKLNPDGTSDVTVTHYYFQTYHSQYSSTRNEDGKGRWWIEGNRWCHQSPIINYNTKDCYDLTTQGAEVRLYYAPCTDDSSQLCKSGRLAGVGEVK